jgi:hypothetical protein
MVRIHKLVSFTASLAFVMFVLVLGAPTRAAALRCVCDTSLPVSQAGWATASSCAAAISQCQTMANNQAAYWCEPYGVCYSGDFTYGVCQQGIDGQFHVDCSIMYQCWDCSPDHQ